VVPRLGAWLAATHLVIHSFVNEFIDGPLDGQAKDIPDLDEYLAAAPMCAEAFFADAGDTWQQRISKAKVS
jgi:hypothetical protein